MNSSQDVHFEDLNDEFVRGKLPYRSPSSHKGSFGRVLVIGGSDPTILDL